MTRRLLDREAWLDAKLVGEKARRDGLLLELPGRVSPVLAVEMGVRPRRGGGRLLELGQAVCCALVLLVGFGTLLD